MFCTFPQKISIVNHRLDCIFLVLWLGLFSYLGWDFVSTMQYTANIPTNIIVKFVQGRYPMISNTSSIEPLCKQGTLHSRFSLSSISCPGMCNLSSIDYQALTTPCYYALDFLIPPVAFDTLMVNVGRQHQRLWPGFGASEYEAARFDQVDVLLNYTIILAAPIPPFWAGLNDAMHQQMTDKSTQTIVLDRKGVVWKIFGPHDAQRLQVAEMVWLAKYAEGETALLRNVQLESSLPVTINQSNLFGSPSMFPLWIFFTGADVRGHVSCYNNNYDLPPAVRNYPDVDARFHRPVCVVSFELQSTGLITSFSSFKNSSYFELKSQRGVRLKMHGIPGRFRCWDFTSILSRLVALLVLLKVPIQLVEFIALHCLGELSAIYRRATFHKCSITEQCGAVATHLLQSASTFLQLADVRDSDGENAISRNRLYERFSVAFSCLGTLDQREIAGLVDFVFKALTPGDSSTLCVGMKQYQQACLINEDIDFCSMGRLFDADQRRHLGELLFTPPSLRRELQIHVQAPEADSGFEGEGVASSFAGSGKPIPQVQTRLNKQEEKSDDMPRMLAEDLQLVWNQVTKIASKVKSLEIQLKNLNLGPGVEFDAASSATRNETDATGPSSLACKIHTMGFQCINDIEQTQHHGFGTVSSEEDCSITSDAGNLKSLEIGVAALRQTVKELEIQQQFSTQEARYTLQEIHTLRNELSALASASLKGMQDASADTRHDAAWPNRSVDDTLLRPQSYSTAEYIHDVKRGRQDQDHANFRVARSMEANEPKVSN